MHSPLATRLWAAFDWELTAITLGLLVLGFIGFIVVMRVRRWQRQEAEEPLTRQQQLEQYQAMLDQGLLDKNEFERLRNRLERSDPQDSSPPGPA